MIILDTHTWIWWENESEQLLDNTRQLIESADWIGIPAICCWELAMLVEKNGSVYQWISEFGLTWHYSIPR